MAQHGYLREYDEAWDRDDERDRWRDERRERGWRDDDRDFDERGRGFMFGDRDRYEDRDRHRGRGFFERMGDETRSWLRDDEREARGRGPGRFEHEEPGRRRFSADPHQHYLSWREKQMEALDRDYEDYCREREQQFHQDFDTWRSQRQGNQPLQTGMTQTGTSDPVMELDRPLGDTAGTTSPMGAATLGTNSSEEGRGRGRR